jgi:hypothetical protein
MQTELATNPVGEAQTHAPAPGVAETTPQTPPETEETNAELQPEGHEEAQLDDSEEVEYEGNRYKVPKAIAPALLRQADYTKKTQEVAEIRRAAEAEKTRLADEAKAFQEDRQEHVQAFALHEQLKAFQNYNWQQAYDQDFMEAQKLWNQFTLLQNAHRDVVGRIHAKQSQRQSQAAAERATLRDQTRATLAKEIPNWSTKAEQELTDYAVKHGYKAEEVKLALDTDARPFRFLHKAFLYDQLIEKQRQAARAQPSAEPMKPVGGTRAAPPQGLSDKLSTEEWVRRRNAQLARRA